MREFKFRGWFAKGGFCFSPAPYVALSEFFEGTYEVIEQFTGLRDKNGKEIYEGDIARYSPGFGRSFVEFIGAVCYDEQRTGFIIKATHFGMSLDADNVIEVIGNIHENPELLQS